MEIPMWWLVITAIFAIAGTLALVALAFVILRLVSMIQEMQPKIHAISDKVEQISVRVESIAGKVEDITGSAKGTIEGVMTGANKLISSLTSISEKAEQGLAKFAPLLVGVKLASSLFQAFKERKSTPAKITANLPATIEVEANTRS